MSSKLRTKIATAVVGATTIISLSIPVAFGQSATDLQTQINALLQQITLLQAQLGSAGGATGAAPCPPPTSNLTLGSSGAGVQCLQKILNFLGFTVSATGAGSPGSESTYFGARTRTAVSAFQAANGVSPAAGYFGSLTRAALNSALAVQPTPTPTTTPAPTGTPGASPAPGVPQGQGLTVTLASDQPAQGGLFGESFASRPFTKLLFSASADGPVTVTGLTVERTGPGADAAFSGVINLDEDGVRMGDSKTFGSNHRLNLNNSFTVPAGGTRMITLAGDSDSDQDAYAGQYVSLALVGVTTQGGTTVTAGYPLAGNVMTVNGTLAIGVLTLDRGPTDPGVSLTKEAGTTNYTFSSIRATAGSVEDVNIKSVRWNQSGSAATGDLANVKVYVDSTAHDTTVSTDGKYYTAKLTAPIKIEKGLNKEILIKGDIVNGSNRTVDFDLYRYADIQATGLQYGYDMLPTATEVAASDDDGAFHAAQPNFDAFQVTIGAGSLTVERATSVGAQNVAENLADQALGGFVADVKGEPVSVASMNFDVSLTEAAGTGGSLDTNDITNIKLVRNDGVVVSGPFDGVAAGNNAIRFTDTVTFPVGRGTYTLRGKLGTDFSQNDQVLASTTPASDWTTVRGVNTSQTITPGGGTITMSTMTVKVGSLTFALSTQTASSSPDLNVVAGSNAVTLATYVLDATESGEDLRITSSQLNLITLQPGNAADDLTNCALWDGTTALNTGTNVVNPSNSDAVGVDKTFTFDTGLIIPKGTVKSLNLKCNVVAGGTITRAGWSSGGLTTAANQVVVTGLTSGTSVAETTTTDSGRTNVIQSAGTISIALDSASPSLKLVQAGTTDQTLAVLRFNSLYEDIKIDLLGLQIATSTATNDQANASNSPSDFVRVTLWDGSTQVGNPVVFTSDYATATLSNFVVPADGQKLLTIKADISSVNVSLSQAIPGHLISVDWDGAWGDLPDDDVREGAQGAKATGLSSGNTIYPGTAATVNTDTASNGARIVKAIPTIAKLSTSGKFTNTSDQSLFRFKVEAPAGTNGVSLYSVHFTLSTTTTSVTDYGTASNDKGNTFKVTNIRLFCYSDTGFSLGSCGNSTGQLNQFGLLVADGAAANVDFTDGADTTDADSDFDVFFNPTASSGATAEAIRVDQGTTRYFELRGDVTGASSTPNISTKLHGDAAWIAVSGNADNTKLTVSNTDYAVGAVDSGESYFTAVASMVSGSVGTTTKLEFNGDFVWSDNATNSTQGINSYSWINGFLLPGLPTSFTGSEVLAL